MRLRVASLLKSLFSVEPHERLKLLFLSITFFFIIASYTILKELKDSIFVATVGREYINYAKPLSMLILVPAIIFYSFLVDRLRRYHLLYFYSFLYGIVGLIFALLLQHPTIGLLNHHVGPHRLFGWLFYFFYEGYSPFMVGVFWAFANSVTDPEEAKKNYGLMVSGSKLGGMLSAALAIFVLSQTGPLKCYVNSDVGQHQLLLVFSSAIILFVPLVIMALRKNVSGKYMHGYEAAYQIEKERHKTGEEKTGFWTGLSMFVKYPYLLGIFCMVFFYELINVVLNYQRLGIAQAQSSSISDVSCALFKIIFFTHLVGFIISLLGTKTLMKRLGERLCLMLIPIVTGLLLFYFMVNYTGPALLTVFIIMRAINYGFSYPVRESLYIPTVKEIKFKSKSWIDGFGTKFAKSGGSSFNIFVEYLGESLFFIAYSFFFAGIIVVWLIAAILLGRRFERAVAHNEVIGAKKS